MPTNPDKMSVDVDAERFFVDERAGCVAVRDRTQTDPEYQGLHEDTVGVVFYRHGQQVHEHCPTCKHSRPAGWEVSAKDIADAYAECGRLNALAALDAESKAEGGGDE